MGARIHIFSVCTSLFVMDSPFVYHSREFTHRVKSVSMAKFTFQEVESLQKGGNQVQLQFYFLSLVGRFSFLLT